MDLLGDSAEMALVEAVADELRSGPEAPDALLLSTLVLHCEATGVSAPDVLRQALDRVTDEN